MSAAPENMWQPEEEPRPPRAGSLLEGLTTCLNTLLRCLCCLEETERWAWVQWVTLGRRCRRCIYRRAPPLPALPTLPMPASQAGHLTCRAPTRREGGQRLLSAHQEALGIEASSSPPRLPLRTSAALPTESAAAAGEAGPLLKGRGPSSSSSSLPSSLPPMPLPFFPAPRHARQGSAGSQHGSGGGGGGGGGNGGESPPPGASPTKQKGKGGSKLSLLEDSEDICPTCGCRRLRGIVVAGRSSGGWTPRCK